MKTIITFGSNHLQQFDINASDIMLVMEETEIEARSKVFKTSIGPYFCTSYPYEKYAQEFKDEYNMYEITFDELMKLERK